MYSDIVKKGLEKTPHRSLFKASGFTDEEIERPLIGVVSAKNEIIPGHIHLDKIAEAVKTGVRIAGVHRWNFLQSVFATVSQWDIRE